MSQTKVTDNLRDTTQLDATKITTGTIPEARITALDGAKITTGTIPEARITSLDATKLTGNIADARVPASAVTQHVTATDLSPIENDLAILALQNAINGNMTAHGLSNYWIEQFEDSNSITALTTCARNSAEYVSSVVDNQTQISQSAGTAGWNESYSTTEQTTKAVDNDLTAGTSGTGGDDRFNRDWGSGVTKTITGFKIHTRDTSYGFNVGAGTIRFVVAGSTDNSTWVDIGDTGVVNDVTGLADGTSNISLLTGLTTTTAYRYHRVKFTGVVTDLRLSQLYFYEGSATTNASGSFTSTTITPQNSASKSSLGLCLLYKNNEGTNTLNTDIIAKVSADNGSNYSTCVLASKGTFSTGISIAIAPAISVTAGTQLKYKVEFANQAVTTYGSQTQVAQGTGTAIGTMTQSGGLSAAFDGTTGQTAAQGAALNTPQGQEGWLGKDWGSGVTKIISGFKHYSSSNDGTSSNGSNSSGCSITLYGNSTNDTSSAVNLGGLTSQNFRSNSTTYSKLSGLTETTAYRYHWLKFTTGSNGAMFSAEVEFYEKPVSSAGKIAQVHGVALSY